MEAHEIAAKAEEVRKLVESMGSGIRAECRYRNAAPTPAGSGVEEWNLKERDRYYLYWLTDSDSEVEVRVTFEAMRFTGVTALAGRVLDGWRRRGSEAGRRGFWVEIKPMSPG
jgi:hypothetical protein